LSVTVATWEDKRDLNKRCKGVKSSGKIHDVTAPLYNATKF